MNWKRLLILVLAFILYLIIGALIFSALESAKEQEAQDGLRRYKEKLLANLTCLSKDKLEDMIDRVVKAVDRGISPFLNVSTDSNWDFSSAFFFSGTVVTTIGYGRRAPSTPGGRDFCIVYAVFGIPFLGWLLSIVGEFYRQSFWNLINRLDRILCDYCSVNKRKLRRFLVWFVVASLIYGVLVLVPAAIFAVLENWNYRIAHYYSFITLTTIGFGDYVATADPNHQTPEALEIIYDLAVVVWYIFGLSFIAVVISAIGTRERKTAEKIASSLRNHNMGTLDDNVQELGAGAIYRVGESAVQVELVDGIVGPVSYRKRASSQSENNAAELHVPPNRELPKSEENNSGADASLEYSSNNNNGNAFNSLQSDLIAMIKTEGTDHDDGTCWQNGFDLVLQNNQPNPSDTQEKKKESIKKKVSFDSRCNPNDGSRKIWRKATGKRKGSSKVRLEASGEDKEDVNNVNRIASVAMTTNETCCHCACHNMDAGSINGHS